MSYSQIRYPTSDISVVSHTPWPAGSCWANLDDPAASPDDSSTYVLGDNPGNANLGFSAFSLPSQAKNISVSLIWRAKGSWTSPAVAPKANVSLVFPWTTKSAAQRTLTNSYATYTETWSSNPVTSVAWTLDDVNRLGSGTGRIMSFSIQVGLITPLTSKVYWTQVYIQVTFDDESFCFGGPGFSPSKSTWGC